jgi:hypothetical protein
MGRPQIPPELVRVKESVQLERQILEHLHKRSVERGMTRRALIEDILLAWCTRTGMYDRRPANERKAKRAVKVKVG